VSEKNGRWGRAMNPSVTGPGAYLGEGGVSTVSCPSAGNCVAGGGGNGFGFTASPAWVVSQHDGRWGAPVAIPGTNDVGIIYSVSCSSAGNCTAVGDAYKSLVVSEKHGRWGKPGQVPGLAALNKGGSGSAGLVSCPLAGRCTAAGAYPGPREDTGRPFVVSQVK
jgi:hypothetical protein